MPSMSEIEDKATAAETAEERGYWDEAASIWQSLYELDVAPPVWRRALRRAASAYSRAGQAERALSAARMLLAKYPDDALGRVAIAQIEDRAAMKEGRYWQRRDHYVYYHVSRVLASRIGANARSVLDVGSFGTPVLEWFPEADLRQSVDLVKPYAAPGIDSVTADFLDWTPSRKFDFGLCLQVLEHIPEADAFARKLLATCDVLLVTVPYKWPETVTAYHVHDPVDEAKMQRWFGRNPNYSYIARETSGQERLVCVYDSRSDAVWRDVEAYRFRYRWRLPE